MHLRGAKKERCGTWRSKVWDSDDQDHPAPGAVVSHVLGVTNTLIRCSCGADTVRPPHRVRLHVGSKVALCLLGESRCWALSKGRMLDANTICLTWMSSWRSLLTSRLLPLPKRSSNVESPGCSVHDVVAESCKTARCCCCDHTQKGRPGHWRSDRAAIITRRVS